MPPTAQIHRHTVPPSFARPFYLVPPDDHTINNIVGFAETRGQLQVWYEVVSRSQVRGINNEQRAVAIIDRPCREVMVVGTGWDYHPVTWAHRFTTTVGDFVWHLLESHLVDRETATKE